MDGALVASARIVKGTAIVKPPARYADARGERLSALRTLDSDAWRRIVLAALQAADGCIPVAAEALGVSTRTLRRWRSDTGGPTWPIGVHRLRSDDNGVISLSERKG